MRRPRHAGGRLFKRKSGRTGGALSTWTMVFMLDGKEVRESTGETDFEAAQQALRKRLVEIDEGTYAGPDRTVATVGELLTSLIDFYAVQGHRSLRSATAQVKAIRAALGSCRAFDVTTGRVRRVTKSWQERQVTNATINRRLSLLRRAYSLGKIALDPRRLDFSDVFLMEDSPLGKHIDAAAFATIHQHLPSSLKPFFEFAYICGTRKGNLARTTWAHWNPQTREFTWTAAEVKAKKPYVLPLDGRALEIIEDLHRARWLHCRFVFHGSRCTLGRKPSKHYGCIGDFKRAWATACKKAGFPVGRKAGGFVFHNTRHTAVTNLVNAGVPAHEAMTVSGHRTRSVFDRYSLSLKQQTKAALRRVTEYTQHLDTTPTVVPVQRPVQRGVSTGGPTT
jgi:integrase